MTQTTLYERTLYHLRNRNIQLTLKEIAYVTHTNRNWLDKLSQGKIKNPSVNRIQTLYEYLTQTKLELR